MSGGADSDWSVFPVGHEVIQDLDANDDVDKTDLTGSVASEDFDDLDHNHMEQDGADFVIDDLSGNKLRLESVDLAALDANEFEVWLEQAKDLRNSHGAGPNKVSSCQWSALRRAGNLINGHSAFSRVPGAGWRIV